MERTMQKQTSQNRKPYIIACTRIGEELLRAKPELSAKLAIFQRNREIREARKNQR
jgi:hypothetical protein